MDMGRKADGRRHGSLMAFWVRSGSGSGGLLPARNIDSSSEPRSQITRRALNALLTKKNTWVQRQYVAHVLHVEPSPCNRSASTEGEFTLDLEFAVTLQPHLTSLSGCWVQRRLRVSCALGPRISQAGTFQTHQEGGESPEQLLA